MKLEKKVDVSGTIRKMNPADKVELPMSMCSESAVRTAVSRIRKSSGWELTIDLNYPYIVVSRLS